MSDDLSGLTEERKYSILLKREETKIAIAIATADTAGAVAKMTDGQLQSWQKFREEGTSGKEAIRLACSVITFFFHRPILVFPVERAPAAPAPAPGRAAPLFVCLCSHFVHFNT